MTRFKPLLLLTAILSLATLAAADETANAPRVTTAKRAGLDWWSLQPLRQVEPPAPKTPGWVRNPIDAFILCGLEQRSLTPSREADKRTLIRRATFDLTGLPPRPAGVAAFLADDSPDAYEKLVDGLLASPDYGVRWARHWLDLARFGESDGFERDQYRPNAWRYRDWLVDAFNADMPYNRFAQQQIAGDVIRPASADGIIATGFLVGGAHDVVGESQQSAVMRAIVRQDQLEDIVSTVSQTFLGLTANCARCHDHKFDPISQKEYYQLASALAGVTVGERDVPAEVLAARDRLVKQALERRVAELEAKIKSLGQVQQPVAAAPKEKQKPPVPVAEWLFEKDWADRFGRLPVSPQGNAARSESGLHVSANGYAQTPPLTVDLKEKTLQAWVRLDRLEQAGGGVIGVESLDGNAFDTIVFAEREPGRWMAGSEFYNRTQSFDGPPEKQTADFVQIAIVYRADGMIVGYRNGRRYGKAYKSSGPITFSAGRSRIIFGLRHDPPGQNKFFSGWVQKARLYDRALSSSEIAASAGVEPDEEEVENTRLLSEQERAFEKIYRNEIDAIHRQQDRANTNKVYLCVANANPGVKKLLVRGNPATESDVVSPAGIAAIAGPNADFGLPPDAPDNLRRQKLAEWITDARNPLFARAIVNRLWLYHFGDGIVDTPNDFGFNGGKPSNPDLLDWMAGRMQAGGWSIKAMQRLILTSAAYRQSSLPRAREMKADAGNRLLWRMTPRRVEAEALRDAVLLVAGELNPQLGGPGYEDYYTFSQNSTFYEFRDYVGATFNRRSLYRNWIRSGRSPMLDVFDCPDPSTKTPRRAMTTTPLQALALMNDSFIFRMSDSLAAMATQAAEADESKQAAEVYSRLFCRQPSREELDEATTFIHKNGLAAFCRVMFNSSEFVTVD